MRIPALIKPRFVGQGAIAGHIGGGSRNEIDYGAERTTIGGGERNQILSQSSHAAVSGGLSNVIGHGSPLATIGGGSLNSIASGVSSSTLAGGLRNSILASYGAIGGGRDNSIDTDAARATIAGGDLNMVGGFRGSIGGGFANAIARGSACATIAGGCANTIGTLCNFALIVGGGDNRIDALCDHALIVGGDHNQVQSATNVVVGGGGENIIRPGAHRSIIAGGYQNEIWTNALDATISGGTLNYAVGRAATVPGGAGNVAQGDYSFAAGRRAAATHDGTFVWADHQNGNFSTTAPQQFLIRANGGVGIGHNAPDAPLHVVGGSDVNLAGGGTLILGAVSGLNLAIDSNEIMARNNGAATALLLNAAGGNVSIGTATANARLRVVNATCDGSTWNNASDRNLKAGFEPVNAQSILAKVAALPISRWNYTNAPGTRHIGPMAQDFQAAFGLGSDDKQIATVDADGVMLAAIQGLNALLEAQTAELNSLKQELAELRRAVGSQANQSFSR